MKKKTEEMRYRVPGAKKVPTPHLAGRSALREASADDLRVLICLLEYEGSATIGALSDAAGCSTGRVTASLEYWEGCGIIECFQEGETSSAPPQSGEKKRPLKSREELGALTGAETEQIVSRRKLESLISEAQNLYGRMFNTAELGIIAVMAEQLDLDAEYILTLLSFCVKMNGKTLHYAEKVAFSLHEKGITSIDALEEYIAKKEHAMSAIGQVKAMFGIGERKPSRIEEECFDRWLIEFGYDIEVIGIAYDITVNTKGKAIVAYTNSILANWYQAGCRTQAEVEGYLEREKKKPAKAGKIKAPLNQDEPEGSFDTNDFFARALARSYGKTVSADTADTSDDTSS